MASPRRGVRAIAVLVALIAISVVTGTEQSQARTIATPNSAAAGKSRTLGETPDETDIRIVAEAEYLSGRKLTVACSATARGWAQALTAAGLSAADADEYYGFSLVHEGELHLSPYVCEGLRLGFVASTRRANQLQVAWSVDVLVHESVHMGRFTFDEALAEACARIGLPVELHRLYQIAYRSTEMSGLTSAATWLRRTQGLVYQGGTCPAG